MIPKPESLIQLSADASPGASPVIQRKAIMKDSFSRGEPFARILPGIKQIIESGLTILEAELVRRVEAIFDMILSDFDLMFAIEKLPNPRRDILRGQVQVFVDHARTKIEREIAVEFAYATNGFTGVMVKEKKIALWGHEG